MRCGTGILFLVTRISSNFRNPKCADNVQFFRLDYVSMSKSPTLTLHVSRDPQQLPPSPAQPLLRSGPVLGTAAPLCQLPKRAAPRLRKLDLLRPPRHRQHTARAASVRDRFHDSHVPRFRNTLAGDIGRKRGAFRSRGVQLVPISAKMGRIGPSLHVF